MVEWWVTALIALGSGLLGYGGRILQAKMRTKDNQDNLADQAVQRADETFRWAAELSVDRDERKRDLGVAQLKLISEDPKLTPADAARVLAAIDAALAPAVEAWDTEETPSIEGEET